MRVKTGKNEEKRSIVNADLKLGGNLFSMMKTDKSVKIAEQTIKIGESVLGAIEALNSHDQEELVRFEIFLQDEKCDHRNLELRKSELVSSLRSSTNLLTAESPLLKENHFDESASFIKKRETSAWMNQGFGEESKLFESMKKQQDSELTGLSDQRLSSDSQLQSLMEEREHLREEQLCQQFSTKDEIALVSDLTKIAQDSRTEMKQNIHRRDERASQRSMITQQSEHLENETFLVLKNDLFKTSKERTEHRKEDLEQRIQEDSILNEGSLTTKGLENNQKNSFDRYSNLLMNRDNDEERTRQSRRRTTIGFELMEYNNNNDDRYRDEHIHESVRIWLNKRFKIKENKKRQNWIKKDNLDEIYDSKSQKHLMSSFIELAEEQVSDRCPNSTLSFITQPIESSIPIVNKDVLPNEIEIENSFDENKEEHEEMDDDDDDCVSAYAVGEYLASMKCLSSMSNDSNQSESRSMRVAKDFSCLISQVKKFENDEKGEEISMNYQNDFQQSRNKINLNNEKNLLKQENQHQDLNDVQSQETVGMNLNREGIMPRRKKGPPHLIL